MEERNRDKLRWGDLAATVVGACVLAFPVALTEEVWNLSKTLPLSRVLYLTIGSLVFIGLYVYYRYHRFGLLRGNLGQLIARVFVLYFVTMFVSAIVLLAIDHLLTAGSVAVAFKRVVIVSFPASFAATVVEGMGKE